MQLTLKVNGKEFKSIAKPKLKHVRIGSKLAALEEMSQTDPRARLKVMDELFNYITDTFINLTIEDLDELETENLVPLLKQITAWANSMTLNTADLEKKT